MYGDLFIGRPRSVKWWDYKAVRRNRLMQSWLTDLPAIQTGMLVVSAVTFLHRKWSMAATNNSSSSEAVSPLGAFLYSLNRCYLRWPFQTEEVEALPLIAAMGTWLCHDGEVVPLCVPDQGCTSPLFSMWVNKYWISQCKGSPQVHEQPTHHIPDWFLLELRVIKVGSISNLINVELHTGLSDGLSV